MDKNGYSINSARKTSYPCRKSIGSNLSHQTLRYHNSNNFRNVEEQIYNVRIEKDFLNNILMTYLRLFKNQNGATMAQASKMEPDHC